MAGGMDMGGDGAKKDPNAKRWPLWKLVIIACPQLGVQVLWCFIGPNSAPYMRHLGMSTALATLNNMAGPITGFFTGPYVGATSDSCTSRWGRRRPVIAFGLLSLWIAGTFFAASEHLFGKDAIFFAAPMYWIMDVTINILQTPHRALVADLAQDDQQIAMQVVFVFFMSVGNFLGYTIMEIYEVPVEHMLELMIGIVLFNTLLVAIQFSIAKETPLTRDLDAPSRSFCGSCCSPITDVVAAVKDSPKLLYHLAFVQCLVWIGNTAWNGYGEMWFANSVFEGDEKAPKGSPAYTQYGEGVHAFATAGQMKAGAQLVSTLVIIGILLYTKLRSRTVYAPCILIGAIASILAAFFVQHNGGFAQAMMVSAIMPETGSFSIPFGLVAVLNIRAAQEGKQVSTALQMALLNCCVTIGQQICTMGLSAIFAQFPLAQAFTFLFVMAAVAQLIAAISAWFLDDTIADGSQDSADAASDEDSSSDSS